MKSTQYLLLSLMLVTAMMISSCNKTVTNPTSLYTLTSPVNNSLNISPTQIFTCANPGNVSTYQFTFTDVNSYNTQARSL